jgi:hypothetical protein
MSNFLHLNYVLDQQEVIDLLNIVDVHVTRPESKRFSRSARLKEMKTKRENP